VPNPPSDSLGSRVRALRIERGWSQSDLARDLVSTSYISLIESGRRMPEQAVLEALAVRLECTVAYLESGVDVVAAQETELRLRFAELALANGDPTEASERLAEVAATMAGAQRARAMWGMAKAEEARGDLDRAIDHIESIIEGVRRGEDAGPGLTVLLTHQCRLYRESGDLARSVEVGERALAEVHELGLAGTDEEVRLASTLVAAYWERGDLLTARRLAEDVIARAEQNGSRRARGSAYWNASLVLEARGDLARAVELAGRALAMFAEEVDERSLARLRTDCAWLLLRQDPPDVDRAAELLTQSYRALAAANISTDLAYCETELARVELHRGQPDQAIEHALRALSRLRGTDSPEHGRARLVLGQAMLLKGLRDDGLRECRRAADHLRAVGATRQAIGVWREVADTLVSLGQTEEALAAYQSLADCAGAARMPQPQPATAESRHRRPESSDARPLSDQEAPSKRRT
jgi:transcriptional regulator with XRE-family HTH domain